MVVQIHLHSIPTSVLALIFLSSLAFQLSNSEKAKVPNFAFSWLNDTNTFNAGEIATIRIKVLGEFDSKGNDSLGKGAFNPTLTVNGKAGNSSFVSGVFVDTSADDTDSWRIIFIPIRIGVFNVIINDDPFNVLDSSLHFKVTPGGIYPSMGIASWMGQINEIEAGTKAAVLVVPRDAYGNNVSATGEDLSPFNFMLSVTFQNGTIAFAPNATYLGWNEYGHIIIEFSATKAGDFILHVEGGNQTLNGSPLPFKMNPGPIDFANCKAQWKIETNVWQMYSVMEIYILQHDQFGNLVPGSYEFDADVVEKDTNLSTPVADLNFKNESIPGIQLLSFTLWEPGNFLLTISDSKHNRSISNMPLAYTVFTGFCDQSLSIVNGSGLNDSVAGETSQFSVHLIDSFQYPCLVGGESVRVQIINQVGFYPVLPIITPIYPGNSTEQSNKSAGDGQLMSSSFNVIYSPEKSGKYDVYVFCGNVLLNGGHAFRKEVTAGAVHVSLSGVAGFSPKAAKLVQNEILVKLTDTFGNPVLSQASRLKLEVVSVNKPEFSSKAFIDNDDGTYTLQFVPYDVGTYEVCVSFDRDRLSPCPFNVNVYGGEYFPKARDDKISVWEDESVAFKVLANDYFAGGNASVFAYSKPDHGSLLQFGNLFRYTPYIDYYGNDSFMYTVADMNGNLASASVNISVLNIPPQFISFPTQFEATEDNISPRYGGFSGLELRYSDPLETITVSLSAQHGTVLLSPMLMQFWQPIWRELSIKNETRKHNCLILEGCLDVINLALQLIQYLGNENFYGEDTLRVSAANVNGKNELSVPVFVEPVNDPPFISLPKFIILKSDAHDSMIFNKADDKFEFSVGDPDLFNFPGKESNFMVTFSVEVDDGFLVTSLPTQLINTTQLKLLNRYQWHPLQTYVSISKHFMVRAYGIRFHATLNDCNIVMQHLYYHGGDHAVLTVKLNDMGHYGCSLDYCDEKLSMPLYAEATVELIRSPPMNSLTAHTLGTAIGVEFLCMLLLGILLVFFTCKCTFLLVNEKKAKTDSVPIDEPSNVQQCQETNVANAAACCSSSAIFRAKHSSFRQRLTNSNCIPKI